jgi:ribonuclease R
VTGGLILELVEVEGNAVPRGAQPARRRGAPPRKPGKARAKAKKTARKVERRRKQR